MPRLGPPVLCLLAAVLLNALPAAAQTSAIQYLYDDLGRLVAVVDSSGASAIYTYDAAGNLLAITRHSAGTVAIAAFSPHAGPIGAVKISGTGFSATASQDAVTFNGTAAVVQSATTTELLITVPTGATTGAIAVTTPLGSATSGSPFVVTTGGPTITGFSPTIARPGDTVTISGTNFDLVPARNRVTLNTSSMQVGSGTATSLTTTVPTNTGSGHITVGTVFGSAVSTDDLFVVPFSYTVADVDATSRMNIGDSRTVSITHSGKIGLLIFDGAAGQAISLNVTSVTTSSSTITILKPDGTTLATTFVTTSGYFFDHLVLPADGTYTVVTDPTSTATGNVTFTLYDSTDVTGTLVPGTASTVTVARPGQNALLSFSGTAGQRVSLQVTSITITGSSVVILKPDGSSMFAPASLSTSNRFIDAGLLPATGTYVVRLDPTSTNTGNATLTVYSSTDVTNTIQPGGAAVTATITTPGQVAQLTFSGTASERLSLLKSGSIGSSTTVSVLKPDGTALIASTFAGFIDTFTLPVAGTYTIFLDPDAATTGNVTVTLYDVSDLTGTIVPGAVPSR